MERRTIELEKGAVSCLQMGSGKRLLIAFHGFGDSAEMFRVLVAGLGREYTIWAVDLPGHGQSRWHAETFDRQDISRIIDAINCWAGKNSYSLLGFSFGGRIVLSILEEQDEIPEAVFLVAPDGFGTRGMRLPTLTPLFVRRWLRARIGKPWPWLHLAGNFRKWGILDAYSHRLIHFFINNATRRDILMQTWLSLHHFPVRRRRLRQFLRSSGLPVTFILGRCDELIPFKRIEASFKGLPNARIILVEKDHWLVDEELGTTVLAAGAGA